MSPFDMLLFTFFILVTIKALSVSIDYWKDIDNETAEYVNTKTAAKNISVPKTFRTAMPSSVRITPIKRVGHPAGEARSYNTNRQYHLNDKGAA